MILLDKIDFNNTQEGKRLCNFTFFFKKTKIDKKTNNSKINLINFPLIIYFQLFVLELQSK